MSTRPGTVKPPTTGTKITARKYLGDDTHSWAVFINGTPFVTGLTRREVPYYKAQAAEIMRSRT